MAETIHGMLFGNTEDPSSRKLFLASIGYAIQGQLESRFGTQTGQAVQVATDDDLQRQGELIDRLSTEQLSQLAKSLEDLADRKLTEDAHKGIKDYIDDYFNYGDKRASVERLGCSGFEALTVPVEWAEQPPGDFSWFSTFLSELWPSLIVALIVALALYAIVRVLGRVVSGQMTRE